MAFPAKLQQKRDLRNSSSQPYSMSLHTTAAFGQRRAICLCSRLLPYAIYNFSFIHIPPCYNESLGVGTGSCAGAYCVCSAYSRMSCDGARHAMFPSRWLSRWNRAVSNSSPIILNRSSHVQNVYLSLDVRVGAVQALRCVSAGLGMARQVRHVPDWKGSAWSQEAEWAQPANLTSVWDLGYA